MNSDVLIKIVDDKGSIFEAGPTKDWRFQKGAGLSGFSDFSADMVLTENFTRDGGKIEARRLGPKDRVLKIVNVYPKENPTERERFKRFFKHGKTYKVYATYMGTTYWGNAEIQKLQLSEDTQTCKPMKATIGFKFENPYWMSVDDFGKNIAEVQPQFGFPWFSIIGYGTAAGIFNFSHEVTLSNDGDSPAYPRITMKASGAVEKPEVRIDEGFVRFNRSMEAGDELVLDFEATPPTVRFNGENALGRCDRASNFDGMILEPGDNVISFDAVNGSANLEVSVYFNKLYTLL